MVCATCEHVAQIPLRVRRSLHHSFGGAYCVHFGAIGLDGTRATLTPQTIGYPRQRSDQDIRYLSSKAAPSLRQMATRRSSADVRQPPVEDRSWPPAADQRPFSMKHVRQLVGALQYVAKMEKTRASQHGRPVEPPSLTRLKARRPRARRDLHRESATRSLIARRKLLVAVGEKLDQPVDAALLDLVAELRTVGLDQPRAEHVHVIDAPTLR